MSASAAKANLAGLLGNRGGGNAGGGAGRGAPSGGVSAGPSASDAKANLGALLGKRGRGDSGGPSGPAAPQVQKPEVKIDNEPSAGDGGGDSDEYDKHKSVFKKYEMVLKMTKNVYSAVGKMRQDGVDKKLIDIFTAKHSDAELTGGSSEKKESPEDFNLEPKGEVEVSKNVKMKRLHWEPVPMKLVPNSIWERIYMEKIDYEPKKFELHFQVKQRKPEETNIAQDKPKQVMDGSATKLFVGKKRSQQVQIGLKKIGLTNEQLRHVLHNMDEKEMDVDRLEKLLDVCPSMEEQTETEKEIVMNGTGNPKHYGIVEQFFYALYDFYDLRSRLELWMFKQQFDEITQSLIGQYKSVEMACTQIRTNKELLKLFTIILAFGNHMNAGTRKGRAYGFNIKVINNMSAIKSMDNSKSLLMYIYEFCDRKYPNVVTSVDKFKMLLKSAKSIEMDMLKTAYDRVKENMTRINNLITSDEIENYDVNDRFLLIMTKFYKTAQPKMKKFNMQVGSVVVSTKRLMKKFCFGSEDEPETIENLFKCLFNFTFEFDKAKQALLKLEQERQKKLDKRKREAKKKGMAKNMLGRPLPKSSAFGKQVLKGKDAKEDDEDEEEEEGFLNRSESILNKEFQKQASFRQAMEGHKRKLTLHIQDRANFVISKGEESSINQNPVGRRISSMYKNDLQQLNAIQEAKQRAEMIKYNKFPLPALSQNPMGALHQIQQSSSPVKNQKESDFGLKAPPKMKGSSGSNSSSRPTSPAKVGAAKAMPSSATTLGLNSSKEMAGSSVVKRPSKNKKKNVPPPPSGKLPMMSAGNNMMGQPFNQHQAFINQNQMGLNISTQQFGQPAQGYSYGTANNPQYAQFLAQQQMHWQNQQNYWNMQQQMAMNKWQKK